MATPLLAHVTTPVGEVPAMLAEQVVRDSVVTGDGEHVTLVVEVAFVTESEKLPVIPGLFESPA